MAFVVAFVFIVGELLDGVATQPTSNYNRVTSDILLPQISRIFHYSSIITNIAAAKYNSWIRQNWIGGKSGGFSGGACKNNS